MSVQIALLRGVNVGGKKLKMADLVACCDALGLTRAKTLLASGNVVFQSSKLVGAALEAKLAGQLVKSVGLETEVFVRDPEELDDAIRANPFRDWETKDPSHLLVMFLKEEPGKAELRKLDAPRDGPEQVAAKGRHVYITFPKGIADSKLKIDLLGTTRNWNTVRKLAAAAGEMERR